MSGGRLRERRSSFRPISSLLRPSSWSRGRYGEGFCVLCLFLCYDTFRFPAWNSDDQAATLRPVVCRMFLVRRPATKQTERPELRKSAPACERRGRFDEPQSAHSSLIQVSGMLRLAGDSSSPFSSLEKRKRRIPTDQKPPPGPTGRHSTFCRISRRTGIATDAPRRIGTCALRKEVRGTHLVAM